MSGINKQNIRKWVDDVRLNFSEIADLIEEEWLALPEENL